MMKLSEELTTLAILGAGIVTKIIELYQKLCNEIRAGTVYVNCHMAGGITAPFAGSRIVG